jgi:uncharacterized protein (DUF1499 family)
MSSNLILVSCMGLSLTLFVSSCSGVVPANLGVKDGKLAPCPTSPNCVSSLSSDREQGIAPIPFTGTAADAMARLRNIILQMKRSSIIVETGTYLHAEYRSAVFRFVDDVEFLVDDNEKVIHVRSAARLGQSDFGVNRRRIEEIRAAWKAGEK